MADAARPGWKTTEFWGLIAAIVVASVLSSGVLPDGHPSVQILTVVGAILASLGYTASRTIVKKIESPIHAPAPETPAE